MAVRQFDPIREILSSGKVLFAEPLLALPNVVAALVPLIVLIPFGGLALLSRTPRVIPITSPLLISGVGIAIVVGIVLAVLATGALYRGAADALSGRRVTISSLTAAGLKYPWNIFGFYVVLFVAALAAELLIGLLAMVTQGALGAFGIVVLIAAAIYAGFTLMYSLPALVVGGKSPGDAIIESGELAWTNIGKTIALVLATIGMAACIWVVDLVMGFGPANAILAVFEFLLNAVLQLLFVVFSALFAVRFYTLLSDRESAVDLADTPGSPLAPGAP